MTEVASIAKNPGIAVNGYHSNGSNNGNAQGHFIQPDAINWDAIITEDDTPVDNYTTEQHSGLQTDTLYDSWAHSVYGKTFIVAADVGIFSSPDAPPIVPDFFLSLGVTKPTDRRPKRNRSYFIWEVGKVPEVVVEIVSNQEGEEEGYKKRRYADLGIRYYAVFDPLHEVNAETLRLYQLQDDHYVAMSDHWMPEVELGLMVWYGEHQGVYGEWLRWCDQNGVPIPTGQERAEQEQLRAEQERQRAEQERQRAKQERQRAEQERQRAEQEQLRAEQEQQRAEQERLRANQERLRAERLAAKLRELGVEADDAMA
ncbi:MAG: Uma2 family endonuclease [Caldilineaceae bacterium]